MPTATLDDRALISVAGPDAEHFLQTIVTCDLDVLQPGLAKPGALLSPQGKILFDFLISRTAEPGFLIECRSDVADDFLRRLTLYRLRAKVEIGKRDQTFVTVSWQSDSTVGYESERLRDARFTSEPVFRTYGVDAPVDHSESWHTFRISQGVPESGDDYALGDAFPHDVLLDQTGAVGFRKGCYVGQEVVSRMQHRGTARRRVLMAVGDAPLPAPGTVIRSNGRALGTLGSVSGTAGLALVRIDKVKAAMDHGVAITADGVELTLSIPAWAQFGFPQEAVTVEEN